jgi:hypothetical protein
MSNPNLDRIFTYDSILEYYTAKLASKTTNPLFPLLKESFVTLDDFGTHLQSIKLDIHGDTWEVMQTPINQAIWEFREYIFASSMLFLGTQLANLPPSLTYFKLKRLIPSDIDLSKNTFTIIGSQKLSSDIDVTIQGSYTYIVIMLLEDLFEALTETYHIPIKHMDVEFYGDFRILKKLFINTNNFSNENRFRMLIYAYIGYFRSTHIDTIDQVSDIARLIGTIYLKLLRNKTPIDTILQTALNQWHTTAPGGTLNRETFYKTQTKIDEDMTRVIDGLKYHDSSHFKELAIELFFLIADADIHRPESYILGSTAVHVVETEQVKGSLAPKIDFQWFTKNAQISLDKFAYLASSIEQLGYLEHYHPSTISCSKKGVKYFGRMIRALQYAKIITNAMTPTYIALNAYRKNEGSTPCPYDIHDKLNELHTTLSNYILPKSRLFTVSQRVRQRKNRYSRRLRRTSYSS